MTEHQPQHQPLTHYRPIGQYAPAPPRPSRLRLAAAAVRVLAAAAGTGLLRLFTPQPATPILRGRYDDHPDAARIQSPRRTITRTEWFHADITTALQLADTGDLSMVGQICRALRRDGTIAGLLAARCAGLVGLPKQFRGDDTIVAQYKGTADEQGQFDKIFPATELALLDGDGILAGVAIGEIVEAHGVKRFVRLDVEHLRYNEGSDTWHYQTTVGLALITPGDGRWILHMPGGYVRPWQNGLWPALMRAWIDKDHALNYRASYNGKLANPARAAKYPSGAPDVHRDGFLEKLIAWGANTVFALPPGWEVDIIESNGRGFEVFQSTIDTSNKEFSICISGQEVTTTGSAGFGNSAVFERVRAYLIQSDGTQLSATVSDQGLVAVVREEHGQGAKISMAWDTQPAADLEKTARSIESLGRAIGIGNEELAAYGEQVDARELARQFALPTIPLERGQLPSAPAKPAPQRPPMSAPEAQEAA